MLYNIYNIQLSLQIHDHINGEAANQMVGMQYIEACEPGQDDLLNFKYEHRER